MTNKTGILILNSGSTSLKFAVYVLSNNQLELFVAGAFSGMPNKTICNIKVYPHTNTAIDLTHKVVNHEFALETLFAQLKLYLTDIDITYVGHRIVHGGAKFSSATKLTPEILDYLETLTQLEPSHQPYQVLGARIINKLLPNSKQSATFDTAFHNKMPDYAKYYAVSKNIHNTGVRHWGFHGISYHYINNQLQQLLPQAKRAIVAHLGGGCSLCAIKDGVSIDTTMQFGAITGLAMSNRSGDFPIDAALYLLKNNFFTIEQLEQELSTNSGLLGVSNISNSMQDLEASTDNNAKNALAHFEYSIIKYIGAYTALLAGLDVLVFSGGIGEHDSKLRSRLCTKLAWLGIKLDETLNQQATTKQITKISSNDSTIAVYVIPTNEELVVAQDLLELYLK
jgi:acetate kinase